MTSRGILFSAPVAVVVNLRRGRGPLLGPMLRIDRCTPFGNPFKMRFEEERARVIAQYREWWYADAQEQLRYKFIRAFDDANRNPLLGPVQLACWCAPRMCHGDVLAEYAQRISGVQGGKV